MAHTLEKGHGRIETRTLSVGRECVLHLGWPGARQVCRIERTREQAGRISREIAYAITSLPPERTGPEQLLTRWRDHWLIENRLHWRRDVIAHEDQSRIRSGAAPGAVAALRNAMMVLARNRPETLRASRAAWPKTGSAPSKPSSKAFFE
ncbi:MAG: ISAs1 family transposase [Parafilimonas terrae]|nr:ISAs1 family transposase [Parafilimonas terrae]